VAEIGLDRPRIFAGVGQRVTGGMPQHDARGYARVFKAVQVPLGSPHYSDNPPLIRDYSDNPPLIRDDRLTAKWNDMKL
jgi:hypothetical protein